MSARRSISMVLVWLCGAAGGLLLWSAPALAQREHVYSSSFGSEGSGDSQLLRPGGLAVNESTGDVYVIDRGNDRVEIFSSTGAYVGQFNGSASPSGAFSWPTREEILEPPEGAIAVDNSKNPLDPSAGDVYVLDTGHGMIDIDKFTASGTYLGQVLGSSPTSPFPMDHAGGVFGVAVNANGMLEVLLGFDGGIEQFNDARVNEYVSHIRPQFRPRSGNAAVQSPSGLAFDSEGNFYMGGKRNLFDQFTFPVEFNSVGTVLAEEFDGEETAGLAVDVSSNDVYVDNGAVVAAYDPSGLPIERFGSPQMHASEGIAVNSSTGMVYTSDPVSQAIEVFTAFVVPDVSTGGASNLAETSATLSGVVGPDGLPVSSCEFEYGTTTAYGQTAACSPSSLSGNGSVGVSANVSGLQALTRYHFRLAVSNANGSNQGQDHTFVTPEPVAISEQSVTDVTTDSAQLSALVNPGGADTTFHFEYGTSTSYGQSVPAPEGDLGAGTGSEPVSIGVEGLLAQTTYHVRIAATNLLGTVYGPDQTFTTQAGGGAFALPDGRMWEMVSPPGKYGAAIEPPPREGLLEAAEDGSAISYVANGPIVASSSADPSPFLHTQVLSKREAGGWSSQDIGLPSSTVVVNEHASASEYFSFSSDLSQALVEPSTDTPLSSEATEKTVYLRDNRTGSYLPLVTAGNVQEGVQFDSPEFRDEGVRLVTGTPDLSHVLVLAKAPLTSHALSIKNASPEANLYEWEDGQLTLVSVLPDGAPVAVRINSGSVERVMSSDGSRVFFEGGGEHVYMRETVAGHTVEVSAPAAGVAPPPETGANFQTASVTGSKVFFLAEDPLTADSKLPPTKNNGEGGEGRDLYVYDSEAKTLTDLTVDRSGSETAHVSRVLGASEDGSIVYFVAKGALAEGAEAGGDNLYVESLTGPTWSPPRLIAVLSSEDEPASVREEGLGAASRVSPDGRFLAFMSAEGLTGYDNRDAVSGQLDEEVFLYDETSGHLTCVSCNPTGSRPTGVFESNPKEMPSDLQGLWQGHWLAADIPGLQPTSSPDDGGYEPYQSRYLSDEGRLFFNSFDSLVPQDTDGQADVYEWEPEGVGTCGRLGGCVSLISSGTSGEASTFLDASGRGPGGEEGEDVFFLTASRLTSRDKDTSLDVYDAHVCSKAVPCVNVPVLPPECSSGDSCKAAPSLQPAIFGAPASATFSGSGNLQSPAAVVVPKKGVKKPVKHKKKKRSRKKRRMRRARARKSLLLGVSGAKGQGR